MRQKIRIIKLLILVILVLSITFSYYYCFHIAPSSFKIKEDTITNSTLPKEFKGFEIGFISDLNIKDDTEIKRLKKIVTKLNQQKVDMVIFGGDLFQSNPIENEKVIEILSSIESNYGKFAVLGEKDLAYLNDVTGILNEGGFEVLHNEYRTVYYNNATISLFGLESNGDISGLVNENNESSYKIVAVHEPDYFDQTTNSDIALQLSGHTMGGYIKLPFIGGLDKKSNGTNYVSGKHVIDKSTLIISNGLTLESNHSYRFNTSNQINIITLKK